MVEDNHKPVLLTYIINLYFKVYDYIKYGWDVFLIDPDGGANVQQKLQAKAAHTDTVLLQSIPKLNDKLWSKQIYKIPKITFGTIYDFLVECKMLAQKANCIDNIIEKVTVRHSVVKMLKSH